MASVCFNLTIDSVEFNRLKENLSASLEHSLRLVLAQIVQQTSNQTSMTRQLESNRLKTVSELNATYHSQLALISSRQVSANIGILVVGLILILIALFLVYFVHKSASDASNAVINYIKFYTHVLTPTQGAVSKSDLEELGRPLSTLDAIKRGMRARFSSSTSSSGCTADFASTGYMPKYVSSSSGSQRNKSTSYDTSRHSSNHNNNNNPMPDMSNEQLKIRMKRSESWDAKNRIYSNSSVIEANLAEKKKKRRSGSGEGVVLPINIQDRYSRRVGPSSNTRLLSLEPPYEN